MFRLFLRHKLFSAPVQPVNHPSGSPAAAKNAERLRNRRVFDRFAADHKHLTLMNEQDILLIREISAKGFSTEVAPRTTERLNIGDVYEARVRYVGEIYDLEARVAWKADQFIGFEIVNASRETLSFINRIILPMEVAASLKEVDANFMNAAQDGKVWFHGDNSSDLYVWHDPLTKAMTAWQLTVDQTFVEWREVDGLSTGTLRAAKDVMKAFAPQQVDSEKDARIDPVKKQFALDVFMAAQLSVIDEILKTLTSQR